MARRDFCPALLIAERKTSGGSSWLTGTLLASNQLRGILKSLYFKDG
jgi:hypothetical protein